jgi:hypothetical protein
LNLHLDINCFGNSFSTYTYPTNRDLDSTCDLVFLPQMVVFVFVLYLPAIGGLIATIHFTQVGMYGVAYGLGSLAAVMQVSFHSVWKNVLGYLGGRSLWRRLGGWIWAQ